MTTGRPPVQLHDVYAVVEQVRVGLSAQREVVLDAVVAVLLPRADADVLDAAAALLAEPGLAAERAMALLGARRAQVERAFSRHQTAITHAEVFTGEGRAIDDGADADAFDGDLDVPALLAMRQGLLATRAAIENDLEHRRMVLAHTQPSGRRVHSGTGPSAAGPAVDDTVETERWNPQDAATLADAARADAALDPAREAVLGLEGALRAVAAELAENARALRRRQDAEVGLELLDNAVVADARALARRVLVEWLRTPEGAHRFWVEVFPVVLTMDDSALGVLLAARSLSQALRALDALTQRFAEPATRVSVDDNAAVARGLQRLRLWARALGQYQGWGQLSEMEDVWGSVLAVVDDAFVGATEDAQRDGAFLAVVHDERLRVATRVVARRADVERDDQTSPLPPASSPRAPSSSPTKLPARLDRYTLLERLGGGGMGEVFLARQDGPRGFAKRVVIKCIHSRHATDAHFISLFQREARVVARLAHDHVIAVFDVGVSGGRWFMAVEHLQGVSGEKLLRPLRNHPSAVAVVARVLADAAHGLAHAHDRDVIHRDISPDNLFVTSSGLTKLIDFGVASVVTEDRGADTALMGKLPYLAPELFEGAPASEATDLWALGVTAFQLLTGVRPFDGGSQVHTVRRITSEAVDLSALQHEVFVALVDELLAKDPARRPNATTVAERLEALAAPRALLAAFVADARA